MSLEQELGSLEAALWTGGAEIYRKILAEDCLRVFPLARRDSVL